MFDFKIAQDSQTELYIFSFPNQIDNRTEYVIIPHNELFNRISLQNRYPITGNHVSLIFWLMPNNHLFDTTNIGTEGEWFFIGGGMAEGTEMDYSQFLNNWDLLK